MLIQYIQFKMQAKCHDLRSGVNSGVHLKCRPQEALLHKAGLQKVSTSLLTGINITGNVCSKASPEE